MQLDTITETGEILIRRIVLAPGEAMFWHTDACRRFSVVIRGAQLRIEYRDSDEVIEVDVYPGLADWDEPEPKVHRAINSSAEPYEEVVTFYKPSADVVPQPRFEP